MQIHQDSSLPIQVVLLQRLAETLEELLQASQTVDRARIVQLDEESQRIRSEISKVPGPDPAHMSREILLSLRSSMERIKKADTALASMSSQQRPSKPSKEPQRAASKIETFFQQVLESSENHDFSEFLPKARVFENSGGHPLFGYDSDNLHRAALQLTAHGSRGRYKESLELIGNLELSLKMEKMRMKFLELVYPESLWKKYYAPIADGRKRTKLMELIIQLYAAESNRDVSEMIDLIDGSSERGQALWNRVVPDEDNPTHEQLSSFYNGRNFPEGDCVPGIINSNIGTAFRLIPVLIANQLKLKSAFDYGGGAGLSTSALMASGCNRVVLIEENRRMLEFAKWRDTEAGITGCEYLPESRVCEDIKSHTNRYDFGVCTEVLEHVIGVEETAARMAKLIRRGGYLYQTTSFALYPHLSHLKPNIRFAGKEDELMASVGFESIPLNIPIPSLASMRLYRRK